MKKPSNYDEVNINNYEKLNAGGHKCIIKQVTEEKSKAGKDMLVISFDTHDTDSQPQYFKNQYLNDTTPVDKKKWRGVHYLVLTNDDWSIQNLKKFCTAVEDSNEGFHAWVNDELDIASFKGLKVGIVFGEEEYTKNDGKVGVSVKSKWFRNFDKVEDAQVPDIKRLATQQQDAWSSNPFDVPDNLEDEGLPFK